jgi:hypothetical protein
MNLVKENISFQRGGDPKDILEIGEIYRIKKWLDEMCVEHYVINHDLTINVDYYVNLDYKNLRFFPEYIMFNIVTGFFSCSSNLLTSLEGCPKYVGGSFYCDGNELTSLEGCPLDVQGSFYCGDNKKRFTRKDVKKYCKVKGENIYVN